MKVGKTEKDNEPGEKIGHWHLEKRKNTVFREGPRPIAEAYCKGIHREIDTQSPEGYKERSFKSTEGQAFSDDDTGIEDYSPAGGNTEWCIQIFEQEIW